MIKTLRLTILLVVGLLVLLNNQDRVEAGKSSKRMLAMLALTMLKGNQKIIIPFPIPMPVKVYEKKQYYYKEEPYPIHSYGGDDYGFGGGHGGHGGGYGGGHGFSNHHGGGGYGGGYGGGDEGYKGGGYGGGEGSYAAASRHQGSGYKTIDYNQQGYIGGGSSGNGGYQDNSGYSEGDSKHYSGYTANVVETYGGTVGGGNGGGY